MLQLRLQSLILIATTIIPLTACERSEGSSLLNEISKPITSSGIPTQIPTAALDEVLRYFQALNSALDSGDISELISGKFDRCGCLVISKNIAEIYKTSNLLGGDYLVRDIAPLRIGADAIAMKVLVTRTEVLKINRESGSVESWPVKDIATNFALTKTDGSWLITGSSVG